MTDAWLPRLPARSGVEATRLAEQPCDAALAKRLAAALGRAGTVSRLGEAGARATGGFYRFRGDDADLFLKIVPTGHGERQRAADAVARFVAGAGVAASVMLPGFPSPVDGDWTLCAYDFIAGRHPRGEARDLRRLGAALAPLHAALARWPEAANVRKQSEQRRTVLSRRLEAIGSGVSPGGPAPERVAQFCRSHAGLFRDVPPDACMVHGDLNPGNLLIADDARIVFLDFEEAVGTWATPAIDLAFLIERLVLVTGTEDAEARSAAIALLDGYSEAGKARMGSNWLAEALSYLALRSFLLLAEAEAAGVSWPCSEWKKFLDLVEMHRARARVINAISDHVS